MPNHRFILEVRTDGNTDVINLHQELTQKLADLVRNTPFVPRATILHLFVVGSTASLTTMEFEVGLVKHDLPAMLQKLIPDDARYQHEATWHDDNGHAHLRAAMIGPSLTIPLQDGKMMTGEYQQVVLIDCDTQPRKRTVIATVME